jgi:hypothetical protein
MRVVYREEPCKVALNRVKGMPFEWSLNPYMGCVHRCTFCYVRGFEQRADRPSDDRYGTSIRVKPNIAEVLRRELRGTGPRDDGVAIGAATDPYQPAEGRYRLTRACIEVLRDAGQPFSIITRGPLIVRDIDVLVEASRRAEVSVTFSVPTVDDDVWRKTEPGTAPPRQRLRALSELVQAGACGVWANLLYLRPGTREHFLACLARDWPELLPSYERLYARRAYLPQNEAQPAKNEVRRLARAHGIRDRRLEPLRPPERAEQLSLLSA